MNSLRTRLLLMLLSVTACLWLAATVLNYQDARHEAEEMLDAQLAQSARLLLAQTRHELVDEAEDHVTSLEALDERELHPYEQKLAFRIRDHRGRVLLTSATPPPEVASGTSGYIDVHAGDLGWRVLVSEIGGLRVEVAQSLAIRDELARNVASHLAFPVILLLPLLGVLIFLVVGHALSPLDSLAGKMSSRTASNLTPVACNGLPRELLPLATALNNLLARLDQALASERRFTADAAHELRTPLAAIQVQAQVALASHNESGRAHALEQVLVGTRRATRLVEQLLRLARLDPLAGLPATRPIDLGIIARQVLDESHLDVARVVVDVQPETTIAGDPELLRVAVRNLLDNALRYSPETSLVNLRVGLASGVTRLSVEDSGSGVAQADLMRLRERFYRGHEVTQEGSGLGLAIVDRIAQLHGARLILENRDEGGLRAMLVWR